tara:strand:- start:629 stop:1051 length:423 start_codon:yes stop_codon:yes gene_type:complete
MVVLPFHIDGSIDTAVAKAILHHTFRTICRGGGSLLEVLVENARLNVEKAHENGEPPHERDANLSSCLDKYIHFFGLWQSESVPGQVDDFVCSQVYVHSKLMIVDDRVMVRYYCVCVCVCVVSFSFLERLSSFPSLRLTS